MITRAAGSNREPTRLAPNRQIARPAGLALSSNSLAWKNKNQDRDQSDYRGVVHLVETMRAPIPTPEGFLPAQAAIIIIGCLFVFLSALWLFVITKAMMAIGIGAVALFTAGACAYAHRYALNPM